MPKRGLFAFFIVTKSCNLRCQHCFIDARQPKENELSLEESKKALERLRDSGIEIVGYTGGEPFDADYFVDLLEYGDELGFKQKINTNGTYITESVAERLSKLDLLEVRISLDGSTPDINDHVRGTENFKKVTNSIENAVDHNLPISIATAWSKLNKDDISNVINLAKDLGAFQHHSYKLVDKGRGEDMDKYLLSESELEEVKKRVNEVGQKIGRQVDRGEVPCDEKTVSYVRISSQGDILLYKDSTAGHGEEIEEMGNVRDDSLEEVLERIRNDFSDRIPKCGECDYFMTKDCKELDNYCIADVKFE